MKRGSSRSLTGRLVAGVILLSFGVLFLLDNFGLVNAGDVFRYWPLILIGLGLTRLLAPGRREDYVGGVVLLFLGSVFLLRALDVSWFRLRSIWPLLLVVLGVGLIWRALSDRRAPAAGLSDGPGNGPLPEGGAARDSRGDPAEAGSVLREFTLMGGGEHVIRSQDFRGGEVTAILGFFEIDLRGAAMAGDSATVEVFALFGGVEFKVPEDWDVLLNGTPILGMFSAVRRSRDGSAPKKKLIIRGTAIMGGVEVKN